MSKKVLITEDDAILKDILANKLAKEGFEILTAEDGEQNMEILRAEKPDLLLLDILLPKKSGMEVLEEMKNDPELSKIPVVAISNAGDPTEIEKAKQLGVKEFLIKAVFDANDVVKTAKKILGEGDGVPQPQPKAGLRQRTDEASPAEAPPAQEPTPVTETPAPQSEATTPATAPGGTNILIVEDDKFLRELAAQKLRNEGFEVYDVSSGEDAFELMGQTEIHVIILDLILPGMSGYDILEKIKKDPKFAAIPVIILSNMGSEEDIEKAKQLGANDYLVKAHFSFGEIIKKIKAVLGLSEG